MSETIQNMPFQPNEGKQLVITTDDGSFERYPVKTPIVKSGDNLVDLLNELVKPYLQDGDMIYMSEKILAISQGRAFPIDEIKPSRLAKFLVKFVYKSPYGIGLGSPWTMELAIRSVGRVKIIGAAIIAGIGKLFGKRGVFYNILGESVRATAPFLPTITTLKWLLISPTRRLRNLPRPWTDTTSLLWTQTT